MSVRRAAGEGRRRDSVKAEHTMVGGLAERQLTRGGGRACAGGGAAVADEPDEAGSGEWACVVGWRCVGGRGGIVLELRGREVHGRW